MKDRKKIELIDEVIQWYDEGMCLYCGSVLNGDMEAYDRDESYDDDWCPNCCENINPHQNWDGECLKAIEKVIHNQKFEP